MLLVIVTLAFLFPSAASLADEEKKAEAHEGELEFHRNHMGAFFGASTHLDSDDKEAVPTLGVDYVRVLSPHFGVGGYAEMLSTSSARNIILLAGVTYYPRPLVALSAGPGIEMVDADVEEEGVIKTESEEAFLFRFGAAWGFRIGEQAALAPTVFADVTKDRWTVVYGVTWAVAY
jgi:hypothetical protein